MDQERIKREEEAARKLKEQIARRKEEAQRKKEEEERVRREMEEEQKKLQQQLADERKRKREEELRRKREEAEREEAERQQRLEEERQRKEEEARALIARTKEEAQRKKEEEERLRELEKQNEEAERLAKLEKIKAHKEAAAKAKEEQLNAEKQAKEEAERVQQEKERILQENIAKAKELAQRKKEEEERLRELEKQNEEAERLAKLEKIKAHKEAARAKSSDPNLSSPSTPLNQSNDEELALKQKQLQENIAKAKEEAKRIKEEKEKAELAAKLAKEEEERAIIERQKQEIKRRKEENQRRMQEEKEREEARKAEEQEATRLQELALKQKIEAHKAEAKRLKEQEEENKRLAALRAQEEQEAKSRELKDSVQKRKMEKKGSSADLSDYERLQMEREEQRKQAALQQKLLIEKTKEEARKRKEEEERLKQQQQEEEQARLLALKEERERKRKEELAAKKAAQEKAEEEKRMKEQELAKQMEETRKLKLSERQRLLDEKRAQEEQERKEQELLLQAEADRVKQFEEELKRRQDNLEKSTLDEQERKKLAQERLRSLGVSNPTNVVNRCGLFSQFGEEPGLEIWVLGDQIISKIAKMKHGLRGLIGESHGTFNVAKAYIILHTSFSNGRFNYQLHSWIGSQTEQAMIDQSEERLKELQIGLAYENLVCVTREKEAEESENFKQYFEKEIEYVKPVILKSTEGPNYVEKRLYLIKGRNNIRAKRVKPVPESLNDGDVFILEDSAAIYQWNGKRSNKMERGKALDLGVQMRIERNARVKVIVIDQGNPQCDHDNKKFWAALRLDRDPSTNQFILPPDLFPPSDEGAATPQHNNQSDDRNGGDDDKEVYGATPEGLELPVQSADAVMDDNTFESQYLASFQFFKFTSNLELTAPVSSFSSVDLSLSASKDEDEEDEEIIKEEKIELGEAKGPDMSFLNERSCLVFDASTEIYVWVGQLTSYKLRRAAERRAKQLKNEEGREEFTKVIMIRSRSEPYIFKEKFISTPSNPLIWADSFSNFDFSDQSMNSKIANLVQEEINIHQMHHPELYVIASEDKRLPIPLRDYSIPFSFTTYLVFHHRQYLLSSFDYSPPQTSLSSSSEAALKKKQSLIESFNNNLAKSSSSADDDDDDAAADERKEEEEAVYRGDEDERLREAEIEYGHLFSQNCYLMLYTLKLGIDRNGNDMTRHIIYFWQGRHSSREDKGTSAMLAGDLAKQFRFCQVERVQQNKEPLHFLSHFSPSFLVSLGPRPFSLPPPTSADPDDQSEQLITADEIIAANEKISKRVLWRGDHLYQIRGDSHPASYAIEAAYQISSLNSADVFVIINEKQIKNEKQIILWRGVASRPSQLQSAIAIANLYIRAYASLSTSLSIHQINETDADANSQLGRLFSVANNNDLSYANFDILKKQKNARNFKLFQCSNAIGVFRVHLLEDLTSQEDLVSRDCFIFDCEDMIYVWLGANSNDACKQMTKQTAEKYSVFQSEDTPQRNTPITVVNDGSEPLEFKAFFHTWDALISELARDPYLSKLRSLSTTQFISSNN